ncbi:hypothetical protein RF11_07156 [Thelohanellus kitauei]|uniref:Uncharacterized protein n=1 Tax=Thelohanellus kitauei TaxID=669202 RepID=A0A0C2J2K8_THEKT|nr:hypothetical protein RF11_07156 [Thelohanellus kitauei]
MRKTGITVSIKNLIAIKPKEVSCLKYCENSFRIRARIEAVAANGMDEKSIKTAVKIHIRPLLSFLIWGLTSRFRQIIAVRSGRAVTWTSFSWRDKLVHRKA